MDDSLWLALSQLSGMNTKKLLALYEHKQLFTLDRLFVQNQFDHIKDIIEDDILATDICNKELLLKYVDKARLYIKEHLNKEIDLITLINDIYPPLLRTIPDPPAVLYCQGDLEILRQYKKIAVVGSRYPSFGGAKLAEAVVREFCRRGYVIVSGLAIGVDTVVHRSCLDCGGSSIAILPCGLDCVYPEENCGLAEQIAANAGLLVSEYPASYKVNSRSLVQRARLQTGISLALCVIETAVNSGTMLTVRYAEHYRRPVIHPRLFAEPNSECSPGIIKLIGENRIKVISSIAELEEFDKSLVPNTMKSNTT